MQIEYECLYDSKGKIAVRVESGSQFFLEGYSKERYIRDFVSDKLRDYQKSRIASQSSIEITGDVAAKLIEEMRTLGRRPRRIEGDSRQRLEQLCTEAGITSELVA
jgi:hypothetical protein